MPRTALLQVGRPTPYPMSSSLNNLANEYGQLRRLYGSKLVYGEHNDYDVKNWKKFRLDGSVNARWMKRNLSRPVEYIQPAHALCCKASCTAVFRSSPDLAHTYVRQLRKSHHMPIEFSGPIHILFPPLSLHLHPLHLPKAISLSRVHPLAISLSRVHPLAISLSRWWTLTTGFTQCPQGASTGQAVDIICACTPCANKKGCMAAVGWGVAGWGVAG